MLAALIMAASLLSAPTSVLADASPTPSGSGPTETPSSPKPVMNAPLTGDLIAAEELSRRQAPLAEAARVITEAATSSGGDEGYAGVELGEGKVVLWWNGKLSGPVEAAIEKVRPTVPVEVVSAPYSEGRLKSAALQLNAQRGTHVGGEVEAILLPVDGSRLRALISRTAKREKVIAKAKEIGVPVDVVAVTAPETTSRCNDGPPWWGGTGYLSPRGTATAACSDVPSEQHHCSMGFGVKNPAGTEYLLTARHCGMVGDTMKDSTGQVIGNVAVGNKSQDAMLVAADASGYIFDGVGSSVVGRSVTGWGDAPANLSLCTSGSTTGTICGYVVSKYRSYISNRVDFDGSSYQVYDMSLAKLSCFSMIQGGDSGGPVFTYNGTGVVARGIISAKFDYDGVGCFTHMGFMDFGRIRTASGLSGITPL